MFNDLKNSIDFFIRNKTKFSRKNFQEKDEEKLLRNYLEKLYTYDVLDSFFEKIPYKKARILDIGSKNWFYAKGEYNFFKTFIEDFILDGVEIDAYRLYSNFYTRYETAKFYTKNLKNVNYIAGNLLDISNISVHYDFIIWILPFVSIEPHKYWGLPQKLFMPEKLLKHAISLLNEKGQLLIINQGEKEAQIQKRMFDNLHIKYEEKGIVKSEFMEYKNNRYAYLIKKQHNHRSL